MFWTAYRHSPRWFHFPQRWLLLEASFERFKCLNSVGNVGCELHDFVGFAFWVKNWIVAGFNPNLRSVFGYPAILSVLEFSTTQRRPKLRILWRLNIRLGHEYLVMLPNYLIARVSKSVEEVFVGMPNAAIQFELNHRHRLGYRLKLA